MADPELERGWIDTELELEFPELALWLTRLDVTGFRSHTTLLSAALAIAALVALGLGAGVDVLGVLLVGAIAVFGSSFYALRELFKRRSGGLGFR